jgi:hypothetical protein
MGGGTGAGPSSQSSVESSDRAAMAAPFAPGHTGSFPTPTREGRLDCPSTEGDREGLYRLSTALEAADIPSVLIAGFAPSAEAADGAVTAG